MYFRKVKLEIKKHQKQDKTMTQTVAFIGLGAMGYRMAAHLTKKFETVYVWNRNFEKAKKHEQSFGTKAVDLSIAVQADIIFSCLPTFYQQRSDINH